MYDSSMREGNCLRTTIRFTLSIYLSVWQNSPNPYMGYLLLTHQESLSLRMKNQY